MTFLETSAMNRQFQEAEAILIAILPTPRSSHAHQSLATIARVVVA